jgi:hypothetical protein
MFILGRAKIRHVAGDVARSFFTAFFPRRPPAQQLLAASGEHRGAAPQQPGRRWIGTVPPRRVGTNLGTAIGGPSAAAVDCGSVRVSVRYLPAVSAHAVDDRVLRAIQGRHAGLCGPRE